MADVRTVLAAGMAWLFDTEQPEDSVIQHHGSSRSAGDRIYGFCPAGWEGRPVVFVQVAEPRYAGPPPDGEVANPLDVPGELESLEALLRDLGHPVVERWNGAPGSTTASFALEGQAHPSLLAAVSRYRAGCPVHGNPLCSQAGCRWYRTGYALIVQPDWPEPALPPLGEVA